MKLNRHIKTLIIFFFLLGLGFFSIDPTQASNKSKTCVVIHSYDYDYKWTVEEEKGIKMAVKDNFGDNNEWKLHFFTLDSKKLSGEKLKRKVEITKAKLEKLDYSAAIITDDFATSQFLNYFKKRNVMVSVAGINGELEDYGYTQNDLLVTGSLERNNLPPSLKIIKKIKSTIDNVFFISDGSITGNAMLKDYLKQIKHGKALKDLGYKSYDTIVTNKFSTLKAKLKALDANKSVLILVAYYTYKDENGNHVDYRIIDHWIHSNTKLLDVGSSTFQIENGRLVSLASSGEEIGQYSADVLFKAIKNEKLPSYYKIRTKLPLRLFVNTKRASDLGLNLPFEILSYSKNLEMMYNKKHLQ